jgi:hypothetical protein
MWALVAKDDPSMTLEVLKAVAGAAGSLLVGVLLYRLERGGRRRRQRREITEELDLLDKLKRAGEKGLVIERIQKRINWLLAAYEPPPAELKHLSRLEKWAVFVFLALGIIGAVLTTRTPNSPIWAVGLAGLPFGIVIAILGPSPQPPTSTEA